MKVAVNVIPLKSAHKIRGIGYYTKHLLDNLKSDNSLKIQEFVDISEVKEADIIHYPWFDLFFHTLPIKRPFPTVVTVHDVIPLIFPRHYPMGIKGKINFLLQKLALRNCRFIITDSKSSKEDIIKYLKMAVDKIKVIPLAVDSNFRLLNDAQLLKIKRKYHLPDRFLLYVGDCGYNKNLPFFIKGFNEVTKDPNLSDVKLVLIGEVFLKNVENIEHPELQPLKIMNRLIKEYKLDDKVIRMGFMQDDELVAFFNLATAYVQPSLYEGFGLPILQALSCGTPVISSNAASLKEVGGDAAVYFDPKNLSQFKSIVLEILQDRSSQQKLSVLGLKQAEKFSWRRVLEEIKRVYSYACQA